MSSLKTWTKQVTSACCQGSRKNSEFTPPARLHAGYPLGFILETDA